MNDQSQLMNPPPSQMMKQQQSQMPSQQPPIMQQQAQMMGQTQVMNQTQLMNQSQMLMNNRGYKGGWSQQPSMAADPNKKMKFQNQKPNFSTMKSRSNWNYNKNVGGVDNRKDQRRMEQPLPMSMAMSMPMPVPMPMPNASVSGSGGPTVAGGYKPPTLNELQSQNRLKARKFYPKRKLKYNNNSRFAPYAPRNTTSFIIRAKKSGGIASLVSPCPVTPAVLPTPIFSPSREVLGDMAKEEWGVDGYGSMKGLIRLRSPGHDAELNDEEEEEEGGSSESDVEEHVEVERRLDHDLSRFEMIYPSYGGEYNNVLENRVDDQDSHIAQLEEENLTLKERLFLMERELADLRRRMQFLERQNHVGEYVNEEVVENGSENDSDGGSDVRATGEDNNEEMEYVSENAEEKDVNVELKLEGDHGVSESEGPQDVCMEEIVGGNLVVREDESKEEMGSKLVTEDVVTKDEEACYSLVAGEDIVSKEDYLKDEESGDNLVAGADMVAKENDLKGEESGKNLVAGEEIVAKKINSKDEEAKN